MRQEYKKTINLGVGFGLFLQILGFFVFYKSLGIDQSLGAILIISGLSLFAWGCFYYAKAKGYSGLWGVLGLLSFPGLLILFFLKNKNE